MESAHTTFFKAEDRFIKYEHGKDDVKDILKEFMILNAEVEKGEYFSKNEDMEDIKDQDVKFLLVPYYMGKIYQDLLREGDRVQLLKVAKQKFEDFLFWTTRLGLNKGLLSERKGRDAKIENMRKERELKKKIEYLEARKKKFGDDIEFLSELERNVYIEKTKIGIIDTNNQLPMIDQEMQLLKFRKESLDDEKIEQIRQERKHYDAPLKITRIDKVGNQLISKNIDYRTNPSLLKDLTVQKIEAPTMTLEEFAMNEMRDAHERSIKEQKSQEQHALEKQLLKEDDEEALERKRQKDTQWDNYTDHNVKGQGNMSGKY